MALAQKGETASEIAAFAKEFRARSVNPGVEAWASDAIDIVGTGGDHAGGFNVSSLVVLVLASAGVTVMKHGNRGITSRCGSADLLAALGVNLEASASQHRQALKQLGYTFFFAPGYHPTFKHIGPVRKALAAKGQRTIFNILGPLINPGRPARVLLGVFSEGWVPRMAQAMDALKTEAGLAVHGVIAEGRGIDELTSATVNRVRGAGRLSDVAADWKAADVGVTESPFSDLLGGDLAANLALTEALLSGTALKGLADTIALNAAVGLWMKVGARRALPRESHRLGHFWSTASVRRKIGATREFYSGNA